MVVLVVVVVVAHALWHLLSVAFPTATWRGGAFVDERGSARGAVVTLLPPPCLPVSLIVAVSTKQPPLSP